MEDALGDNVQINENGEVYLKVDKIVAISKDAFINVASLSQNEASPAASVQSLLCSYAERALVEDYEEREVRCPSCKRYYVPRPGQWECPNPYCRK